MKEEEVEEAKGKEIELGLINGDWVSLVPRPSITANTVEGLVKLLRRMTSGRRWEVWHFW